MSGRQGSFEREAENIITALALDIFEILKSLFWCVGFGIRKLNKKKNQAALACSFIGTGLALLFQCEIFTLNVPEFVCWMVYYLLLFFPVVMLWFIGSGVAQERKKYRKIFEEMGFRSRNGTYPIFYETIRKEGSKKEIMIFKSTLGLSAWKSAKEALEVGFDRNILKFEYGKKKQIIKLTVVPSSCVIPELIYWSDRYISQKNGVIVVGRGALQIVSFDLNRTPHVLIAGETGSGKSVILRCCLWQMINQGAKIFMIDFKGGVEFGKEYEQYGEVVMDRERALEILDMLFYENQYRLSIFRDLGVKNLPEYNRKTGQNLCRIGLFCDEIAEMLDKKGVGKKEREIYEQIEGRISSLARLSRATGINLFLGVQRPDANILTGQIKNNVPVRISGRFADKAASEIVLGNTDAVELPDIKGRFLYRSGNEIIEFQSFLFEDDKALREVNIEVGDMLTETPGYTAALAGQPTQEKHYPGEVQETNLRPNLGHKGQKLGQKKAGKGGKKADEDMTLLDSDEAEKILRQMDEYDMNNLF